MFLTQNIGASSPSSDDDFWYQPAGSPTTSGALVSPAAALKLSVAYACMKVLSETVAQLPLLLYERSDEGKDRAESHPLFNILHRKPNNFQNSFEWRELMQGHVTIRGNAYSEIIWRRDGNVDQLIPLHPDCVKVQFLNSDCTNYRYVYKNHNNEERIILKDSMFHLRGHSNCGVVGMSPIEVEREAIGLGLAAQEYHARFYANDGTPGGWIEHPGKFSNTDQRRDFLESWRKQQTGSNRHRTAVLEYGMKYTQMKLSNKDAQFIESRKYGDVDIARIFRIPPHKIGILDKATFSNIEQQSIEFVTDTMMPWFVRWEQAINESLLPNDNGHFFAEFLVDGLLRGDSSARYTAYATGINTGYLTRNEARKKENLNPIDGLDEPLTPLNMASQSENNQDQSLANAEMVVKKETMAIRKSYNECIRSGKTELFKQDIKQFFSASHIKTVCNKMGLSYKASEKYVLDSKKEFLMAFDNEIESSKPHVVDLIDLWNDTKAVVLAAIED